MMTMIAITSDMAAGMHNHYVIPLVLKPRYALHSTMSVRTSVR